jgi:hypothetical protein
MRITYLLGALFMTTMFILRYKLTRETENGAAVMLKYEGTPLRRLVAQQLRNLARAARDRHFSVLILIYLIATALQSFTFFQILYLKDVLYYSTAQLAVVPAVNSLISIFLFSFVIPKVPKGSERVGLLIGFLSCLAGAAAFLFLRSGLLLLVLFVQGLGAAAFLLLSTYRDSVFMNSVPGESRAELFGLVNMLAMLLSIPTGAFAGWLFSLDARFPFVASAMLFALGAAATLSLLSRHRSDGGGA